MAQIKQTGPRRIPTGRVARLHRLGSMAAGIAGNVAVDSLRSVSRGQGPDLREMLLTPANAARFADELARMRGAAMKVGQLLSMEAGDVLSPELASILERLRAAADPMPPSQLKTVLRDAWGPDWRRAFRRFDTRPIAAASIGQVHRALLRDGRDLAIKVQYPGIAESIDSDVSNLGTLIRMSGMMPKGFDMTPYLTEAKAQLRLEAEYREEARALRDYAQALRGNAAFVIPDVADEWTTDRVLAMTYLPSRPIDALQGAPQAERDRVMTHMAELLMTEIFDWRLVQTDPNFANFRYCAETGRIVLLDFGATRRFDAPLVETMRRFMQAGHAQDRAGLEACAREMDLLPPDASDLYRTTVLNMVETVFAEMRGPVFDFGASDLLTRMREMAMPLAQARVPPPPVPVDMLYIQRKIAGMFLLGTRLGARVPVEALLTRHLAPAE